VIWRRRKRTPAEDIDRQLEDLREHEDKALDAFRLVRKRLGLGIDDAVERVRQHPSWGDVELRHELDDREDELVLQTATVDGMVVLKAYCHDESAFDPPEQDEYRWFQYEIDVDGRIYEVRNYVDDDEASISRREATVRDDDAARIARFLIEHEGVRRVTRYNRRSGIYDHIVALGPGWSGLDPLILLVLRDGPLRPRDLPAAVKEVNAVAPDELEVAASLRRLGGARLVRHDGDRLALDDDGRRLVAAASGDRFWDEWERLNAAVERLPLPDETD
jgi:hypothetical protein